MTLILRGRRFGFSLEEIRQWLDLYEQEGSEAQYAAFVELADRQLAALDRQKQELEATIRDLRRLRDETAASLS
jgi:DNA-binding transcriptional MerR regulator